MRMIVLAALASLASLPSFARSETFTEPESEAARKDPARFTLESASLRIEREAADFPDPAGPGSPPDQPPPTGDVGLDRIVNIASKIWQIIEENRPVVDVRTTYAAAVPEGITHWSQLSQWSAPEGTSYRLSAKNLYGVTVVDVRYKVLRQWGGRWNGKGRYLSGVTIAPLAIDVAWGYRVSFDAAAPSVSNVGTSEDPVASMVAELKWRVATVLKHSEGTGVYYLQGDGVFRELGGPFRKPMDEAGARALSLASSPPRAPVVLR
ncbi:MAG TPA: hypothetical protein VNI01_16800 [Elusimicrobiota bacterium]|nr:hypothetical protein [Elusimicrobiota bacterium]